MKPQERPIKLVPIAQITVTNPRVRNRKVFKEIVDSIAVVGLKKPITVTKRQTADGGRYELVCGQGRLEAFQELGQKEIPAFVIDADPESGLVMSLVENIARRHHNAVDLLADIEGMKRRGYKSVEICQKTGLSIDYVRSVTRLIEKGERRLLIAVEARKIPVTIALEIAEADDEETQRVLQHAYETKQLRGRKLIAVKRLVEQRRRRGKDIYVAKRKGPLSVAALLRTYREDIDKKSSVVRKAEVAKDQLDFITAALRTILSDQNFATLLRAERLDTLPKNIGERVSAGAGS